MNKYHLIQGDSKIILKSLPTNYFHCIVTSPPYWNLRDYFVEGQLGIEKSPYDYINNLVDIFREAKRVLRDDGVMWLVIGDTYSTPKKGYTNRSRKGILYGQKIDKKLTSNMKRKNLIGVPWRTAIALQEDGWILRCDVIWQKENPVPDGAKDRPTRSHEYVFMFSKSEKYFYDYFPIMEKSTNRSLTRRKLNKQEVDGVSKKDRGCYFEDFDKKNLRSVWKIPVARGKAKHTAMFPERLITPCILSSTSQYGCCKKCGAPWKRVLEKVERDCLLKRSIVSKEWNPSCNCQEKEGVRCRVLDPFAGMSTTGVVCLKNDIDYTGIELNPDYIIAGKTRLEQIEPIFSEEII